MPAKAFTIQLDYSLDSSSFFSEGSAERDRLEDAAAFFEGVITTELTAVPSSTGFATDPSSGGPAFLSLNIAADTIVVYVGARGSIGGGALGEGSSGSFSPVPIPREPGNFATWGGSIAVSTDFTWDASSTNSVAAGEYHLYSLLLHELGHVLGVPHLAEGLISTIYGTSTPQEAALDPTLNISTVKLFTDADIAGLETVGWEIAPIPEPSSSLLAVLACLGLLFKRRR